MKYAGKSEKIGDYFFSLYNGKDNFSYTVDQERTNVLVHQEAEEESRQRGGSLNWSKQWKNGLNSAISTSYSDFNKELLKSDELTRIINGDSETECSVAGYNFGEQCIIERGDVPPFY